MVETETPATSGTKSRASKVGHEVAQAGEVVSAVATDILSVADQAGGMVVGGAAGLVSGMVNGLGEGYDKGRTNGGVVGGVIGIPVAAVSGGLRGLASGMVSGLDRGIRGLLHEAGEPKA